MCLIKWHNVFEVAELDFCMCQHFPREALRGQRIVASISAGAHLTVIDPLFSLTPTIGSDSNMGNYGQPYVTSRFFNVGCV